MPSADLRDVLKRLAIQHDIQSGAWHEQLMRQFNIECMMDDEPRQIRKMLAACFDLDLPPETIQ